MKTTKTKPTKKSRITRLTVARLYNLGNYEHVRYEITTEIPPGGSVKQTMLDTWAILKALKPVKKDYQLDQAKEVVLKDSSQLSEFEKAHMDEYQALVKTHAALLQLRNEALNKLDDIGGTSVHTDAKDKWQDEDTPF